jgi:hypothetical protein
VVPGQELPAPELPAVPATVLAGIAVSSEEEGVRYLTAEAPGHMNKPYQAYDEGERDLMAFRTERLSVVDLQEFRLLIQNQANGPSDRYDGQRLVGSVKCKATHTDGSWLIVDLGHGQPNDRFPFLSGTPHPLICSDNIRAESPWQ